jgi:integrase
LHTWRALLARDLDPAVKRARSRELPTLEEFAMQDYLPHAKAHKRSWLDDELRLKKAILPRFGPLRMDMVTTREVQRFHTELASERTPATANRYLALIRRMYSLANQWEVYDGNPAKNVIRFPEHNARERYLSREEVARFLGALDEEENRPIAAGLKFLLFTGLRKSEAFRLEWDRVDRATSTVYLADTKNGRPRTVFLNALAAGVIDEMWRSHRLQSRWVFPGRLVDRPVVNPNKIFKAVCVRAGIAGLRIHDLRHSFASLAINGGASLYDVQKLLGHASTAMTQRYAHLDAATVRNATEEVARQIGVIGTGT